MHLRHLRCLRTTAPRRSHALATLMFAFGRGFCALRAELVATVSAGSPPRCSPRPSTPTSTSRTSLPCRQHLSLQVCRTSSPTGLVGASISRRHVLLPDLPPPARVSDLMHTRILDRGRRRAFPASEHRRSTYHGAGTPLFRPHKTVLTTYPMSYGVVSLIGGQGCPTATPRPAVPCRPVLRRNRHGDSLAPMYIRRVSSKVIQTKYIFVFVQDFVCGRAPAAEIRTPKSQIPALLRDLPRCFSSDACLGPGKGDMRSLLCTTCRRESTARCLTVSQRRGARFGFSDRASGHGRDGGRAQGMTVVRLADDETFRSYGEASCGVGVVIAHGGRSPRRGRGGRARCAPNRASRSRADCAPGRAIKTASWSMCRGACAQRVSAAYGYIHLGTFRAISRAEGRRTHRIARCPPPSRPSAVRTCKNMPIGSYFHSPSRLSVYAPSVTRPVRSRFRVGPSCVSPREMDIAGPRRAAPLRECNDTHTLCITECMYVKFRACSMKINPHLVHPKEAPLGRGSRRIKGAISSSRNDGVTSDVQTSARSRTQQGARAHRSSAHFEHI